jgi:hypothetical protein
MKDDNDEEIDPICSNVVCIVANIDVVSTIYRSTG